MCPMFGNTETFGISAYPEDGPRDPWSYEHLCYWIRGRMVGNLDRVTSLYQTLGQMTWIAKDCGKREDQALFEASAEDVFASFDGALFGCGINTPSITLPEQFAVFNIRIPMDPFDEWRIYLVEWGDLSKFVFKTEEEDSVHVELVERGLFDDCILELHHYLSELVDQAPLHP